MTLGVGITHQVERSHPGWTDRVLAALGNPPYHNWLFDRPSGNGYTPTLFRVLPDDHTQPTRPLERAIVRAQANPTELWLLGNEPHVAESGYIPAATFGAVVEDWTTETVNPWAMPGIILQPDGYEWLERYLDTYYPLPNYWHVHVYWQTTPQQWRAKLDEFYLWAHQRNVERPVIVTETCANSRDVDDQKRLLDYLAGVAEPVFWYASYDYWNRWPWVNLANLDGTLTDLGRHFAQLVKADETIYLPIVEG